MTPSPRLPLIPPSELTPEQRAEYDTMVANNIKIFSDTFKYSDENGALIGPFNVLLHTPDLSHPSEALTYTILSHPSLPASPLVRELIILATVSSYSAPYAIYAYSRICLSQSLFSNPQITSACKGILPEELGEEETLAYEFSKKLARDRGPLERGLWDRATEMWGMEGTLLVANLVGTYCHLCCLLRATNMVLQRGWRCLMKSNLAL